MEKESKILEFKQEMTRTYLKTVSAFSNYIDGEIRFGVLDNGSIKPIINLSEFAHNLENQINDTIRPQPLYTIKMNNNGTISLFVKKGPNPPYFYDGKAYKRNDTATIQVDDVELKRLIMEGSNLSFDELPCNSKQLSFNTLEKALIKELKISSLNKDILRSLNLLSSNGYNNAASLLSDNNLFPGIDIVVFGDSDDIFKERITLEHISLIEQYQKAMDVFERYYVYEKVSDRERIKQEVISEIAFKEVIANAIVHRSYDIKANTKVSMYKDHIEISSPGGLMYGISEEQYLRGAFSLLRNPIIANIFRKLNIIEAFATGIKRTMRVYEDKDVKPSFNVDDYSIFVSIPSFDMNIKKEYKYEEVISKLNRNVKYTRSEIGNILGYKKDKTIRLLNDMINDGLIESEGEGKSITYFLK